MFLEYASIPEREEEIIRRNIKTRLSKNTGSTWSDMIWSSFDIKSVFQKYKSRESNLSFRENII